MRSEAEIRSELEWVKVYMSKLKIYIDLEWQDLQFKMDKVIEYQRLLTFENEKRRLLCWVLGEDVGK